MRREEVIHALSERRTELTQNNGVKSLSLFGSASRDEAGPASDVDLLVEFDRPVGYFGLFALQDYLEVHFLNAKSIWELLTVSSHTFARVCWENASVSPGDWRERVQDIAEGNQAQAIVHPRDAHALVPQIQ